MATKVDANEQIEDLSAFLKAAIAELEDGERLSLQVADYNCDLQGDVAIALLKQLVRSPEPAGDEGEMLTTGQVADLLGVSRPTVVALIDDGSLPGTRVGTHRRVSRMDVLTYLDRSRTKRSDALDELVRLSEDLGLYDAS